jgi:glycosyltransferase involved in cell wall biosynthesis
MTPRGGHYRTQLKIAQIAPLIESVPPRYYGGTERVVSYLTEALVAAGHDVTLFASGDSITAGRLVPCAPRALRLNGSNSDPLSHYMIMLDRVRAMADRFDILHFHIDQLHFPAFRTCAERTVTTLHGRQDLPDLASLYAAFHGMPLVSISNAQRVPVAHASFAATIHHGLPPDLHAPTYEPRGGYLAFLGRISPEKGVESAIAIATAAGLPLKVAAKVDRVDAAYYDEVVKPLLAQPGIEFVGEINEAQKTRFLGDAAALLFPIAWPEPFGLVMIEAMACGTPVLAFTGGSVGEIIDDGLSGCVVPSLAEAPAALARVLQLDRRAVRRRFEERFTAERMAAEYVAIYHQLLSRRAPPVSDMLPPPGLAAPAATVLE